PGREGGRPLERPQPRRGAPGGPRRVPRHGEGAALAGALPAAAARRAVVPQNPSASQYAVTYAPVSTRSTPLTLPRSLAPTTRAPVSIAPLNRAVATVSAATTNPMPRP